MSGVDRGAASGSSRARAVRPAHLIQENATNLPFSLHTRNGDFRVAVDGARDAPALILGNSLGTTLEMWQRQAEHFSARYRVVRYDTRGHGGSPVTPGPYGFDLLGEDVLAIMDALQIERAAFCGVSMGGHTALWLASHRADRFLGAAVCNSAARIGSEQAWRERAGSVRQGGSAAMQALADSAPQRWFTERYVAAHPGAVACAQGWIAGVDPEGYASCCEALATSDLREAQTGISIPVLLLAGAHDPVTTVADAQAMHEAIVGSALAVVPASHLSNLEAPDAFHQAVDQFLARLPG